MSTSQAIDLAFHALFCVAVFLALRSFDRRLAKLEAVREGMRRLIHDLWEKRKARAEPRAEASSERE